MSDKVKVIEAHQVGTVEILKTRTYPLDPYGNSINSTTVIVDPGLYPLYEEGDVKFWMMEGCLNLGVRHMGDGTFGLMRMDTPSNINVRFPSRFYGVKEWGELLAEPICEDGNPVQRLRLMIGFIPENNV